MSDVPHGTDGELDALLQRAVDRQIDEQRALRKTLAELTESVKELSVKQPEPAQVTIDWNDVEERVRRAVESSSKPVDLGDLDERLRAASEGNTAAVLTELRELREAILPNIDRAAGASRAVQAVAADLGGVREAVDGVEADIEGIAAALIDLNQGLRSWTSGVDESFTQIRTLIERLSRVAKETREVANSTKELLPLDPPVIEVAAPNIVVEPQLPEEEEARLAAVEQRMKETVDLSMYLADQIEDLDQLMGKLVDLPNKLEGVVSQAMRRAMAARGKLDREAETALDDALGAIDEHLADLSGAHKDLIDRIDSVGTRRRAAPDDDIELLPAARRSPRETRRKAKPAASKRKAPARKSRPRKAT